MPLNPPGGLPRGRAREKARNELPAQLWPVCQHCQTTAVAGARCGGDRLFLRTCPFAQTNEAGHPTAVGGFLTPGAAAAAGMGGGQPG